MAQTNKNIQTQEQQLIQTLSPQQVLQVRLLEMPIQELEQRINNELDGNESLEKGLEDNYEPEEQNPDEGNNEDGYGEDVLIDPEDNDSKYEATEPRQVSGKEPTYIEDLPLSNDQTFFDILTNQIGEFDVTERQRKILLQLIGSLDDNGLLLTDLWSIADDMSIYSGEEFSESEVQECLSILQQFDPPGIGARSIQECLLIQIDRKNDNPFQKLVHKIIADCYQEFTHKNWDKIEAKLNLSKEEMQQALDEIKKLNPRPGISLGESGNHNLTAITPDFYVTVDDDEEHTVHVMLNNTHIPQLHISQAFSDVLNDYEKNKDRMGKKEKEEMGYIKSKVDSAIGFINAIKSRQNTMLNTMKAIVHLQKEFFAGGDELSIKPLTMKKVAEMAKVDISTVSRVCNRKYVETPYGIFPLKHFFGDSFQTGEGEDVATRIIRAYLKEVIDNEDKHNPLTDEQLAALLKKEKGYDVARRTVAKYRGQLNIPVARMRRI
jgi:RNA polymerase sigma-54 factor